MERWDLLGIGAVILFAWIVAAFFGIREDRAARPTRGHGNDRVADDNRAPLTTTGASSDRR